MPKIDFQEETNIDFQTIDFQAETGGTAQPEGEGTKPKQQKGFLRRAGDVTLGIVETPLTLATGMIAGTVGLASSIVSEPFIGGEEAGKFREYLTNLYTYKPYSETGKGAINIAGKALSPLALPRKVAQKLGGEQWGNLAEVATGAFLTKAPSIVSGAKSLYKTGRGVLASKEIKAGQILKGERAAEEPFLSNVKQAEKVQKQIPELELTYGQKSDFPPAIRAEAITARKENIGAVLFKKIEAGNQQALRDYIKLKFPETGNIDDVIGVIKPQLDKLKTTQKLTQSSVDTILSDMPNVSREGIQRAGGALRQSLKEAKVNTWKQSQELYNVIDDVPVNSNDILQQLKDYEATSISRGESPNVFPSAIIKQFEKNAEIKNIANPEYVSGKTPYFTQITQSNFNQLRGLRGQAYKLADSTTDYQLANNARTIGKIINDGMEAEAQKIGGNVWENFRNAQNFYNNEYVGKFRLGTVGKVLKGGRDAQSRYALTDSEVIGEFFRGDKKGLERIQNLTNALGFQKAQNLVKDYAIYDFKNNVINKATGDVIPQKLAGWYSKHRDILDAVGLEKEFGTIDKAQKVADMTDLKVTAFEQSIAGKMLGVDPERAINIAFEGKGGKNSGLIANELISTVQGNKNAIRGLQNSFKDFLFAKVENTAMDVAGGKMLSPAKADRVLQQYMPAIKVLWRGEPEKIKALNTFQEAVNILNRNKTSQFAGSQTSEYAKAMTTIEKLPFMGYEGVVLRFIVRLEHYLGKEKIDNLLTYGRFNPNFADHLIRKAQQFEKTRNTGIIKDILSSDTAKAGYFVMPNIARTTFDYKPDTGEFNEATE